MGVVRGRRHRYVATLRAIVVALGVLAIAIVVWAAWIVRSPMPKLDGSLDVSGIGAETIVRRDARGIPHIQASSTDDAYFGEGFACAQDRLWQMDLLRREAEGDLSEIFGPATVQVDEYFRTLGLGAIARRSADRADARNRAVLEAYAAGVNAEADSHELPLEFRLLGYRPAPWTAADSIAVGLLITRSQDEDWHDLLLRADLVKKIGSSAAYALMDEQIAKLEEYMPGYAPPAKRAAPTPVAETGWDAGDALVVAPLAEHQGSNDWAIAGSRTTTGKPVLSNDTHLDHSLPSTWWIAHVEGGGLDVEGFTLPGVPGVIIGHNARIAFGVTSAAEDVQDLFVERFASKMSDAYLADGRWMRATRRSERIVVKGKPDVTIDVLTTRHGPIVQRKGDLGLALAWTVLRDGDNLDSIVAIDGAPDWPHFRAALSSFIGPTLNWVYADVDGHIGYQDAGHVPLRASGDGTVPVEGQDERYAWKGEVPFDVLPHALDPPAAFVATANNAVVPATFSPVLSRDYLAPFRIHEIVSRIGSSKADPQGWGAIQGDAFDYPRSQIARAAADALAGSRSPADEQALTVLRSWNGVASVDATAPTLVVAIVDALQKRLLAPRTGMVLAARLVREHHFEVPLVRALDGDPSLASLGITRSSVLRSLVPAVHDAEASLNFPAKALSKWGDVNAAVYPHPLGIAWPLTLLNAPTVPQPGDVFSVFQSRPDFGPSMRFVADLHDWDQSSMLLTLGESGIWTDPHYDDMEQDWVDIGWSPTPFSDAAVTAAAENTLRLEPLR